MSEAPEVGLDELAVDFAGEIYRVSPGDALTIGREGDLEIDDNPYLHRQFLQFRQEADIWWLINVGSRLAATVSDPDGYVQSTVSPGARLPVVFPRLTVMFSAGPTTYELEVYCGRPSFETPEEPRQRSGEATLGPLALTASQLLLVLALCEPTLLRDSPGSSAIPSNAKAAERLGWPITTFNRKLDNVCDKLTRAGVRGLRGSADSLAVNRRARLVEYAVMSRLVTAESLPLLDENTADLE